METAIVTGATSGIGNAIAIKLALEGFEVIGIGRDEARGQNLNGVDHLSFTSLNIADAEEIQGFFLGLSESGKQISALVNAAGIEQELDDPLDTKRWDALFKTNLFGAVECIRGVLPIMPTGVIVNIASVVAGPKVTFPHFGMAYEAGKAALHKVTESVAVTNAPHIRAVTVSPGYTLTPLWDKFSDQEKHDCINAVPIGRFIEPEEVAKAVFQLIDNKAFNGIDIVIDGGLGLRRIE